MLIAPNSTHGSDAFDRIELEEANKRTLFSQQVNTYLTERRRKFSQDIDYDLAKLLKVVDPLLKIYITNSEANKKFINEQDLIFFYDQQGDYTVRIPKTSLAKYRITDVRSHPNKLLEYDYYSEFEKAINSYGTKEWEKLPWIEALLTSPFPSSVS